MFHEFGLLPCFVSRLHPNIVEVLDLTLSTSFLDRTISDSSSAAGRFRKNYCEPLDLLFLLPSTFNLL
jgi:hypothetical protein